MDRALIHTTNLPGYDALKRPPSDSLHLSEELLQPYLHNEAHRTYLNNDTYTRYLKMPKGFIDESDADLLLSIGDELSGEQLPRFSDAAGWAYAEAALTMSHETSANRVQLLSAAEKIWERSLEQSDALLRSSGSDWMYEDSTPFRTALNLAYVQMMKSLVVGNVTDSVRSRTFADTLAIAQSSLLQLEFAGKQPHTDAFGEHLGFLHESNALLSLLYLNDPRYIPIPSSARADSGYYLDHQAHDITIINQHWGAIRKAIPVEIKASASMRDRTRYKALIVRGKMHLAVPGKYSPRYTLEAFASVFEHTHDLEQQKIVDHASTSVQRLLELYQKGGVSTDGTALGVTKFHQSEKVAPFYVARTQAKRS